MQSALGIFVKSDTLHRVLQYSSVIVGINEAFLCRGMVGVHGEISRVFFPFRVHNAPSSRCPLSLRTFLFALFLEYKLSIITRVMLYIMFPSLPKDTGQRKDAADASPCASGPPDHLLSIMDRRGPFSTRCKNRMDTSSPGWQVCVQPRRLGLSCCPRF